MYNLIDGKKVSAYIKDTVKERTEELKAQGKEITLAVIIVGDDPASRVYVSNKEKDCAELGIESREFALPSETTMDELLTLIENLNNDDSVNGILCQLPLRQEY